MADTTEQAHSTNSKRSLIKKVLIGIVALVIVLIMALSWIYRTESGLRFGLLTLPKLLNIHISANNLHGTLHEGFQGDNWHISTHGADIDISHIDLNWHLHELFSKRLTIEYLDIGDVHIQTKETEKQPESESSAALSLPSSLQLPISIHIGRISIGSVSLNEADHIVLLPSQLHYTYDHAQHKIHVDHLDTPWSHTEGYFYIQATAPFSIDSQWQNSGHINKQSIDANLILSGSLERIKLNAQGKSGQANIAVNSTIQPFTENWAQKLPNLVIKAQHINPKQFSAQLPQANIQLAVLLNEQPNGALSGQLNLTNKIPNAFDYSGIPLRQATAKIFLDTQNQLSIDSIQTTWLNKGEIDVSGHAHLNTQEIDITAKIPKLSSQDFVSTQLNDTIKGTATIQGNIQHPSLTWQLNSTRAQTNGSILLTQPNNNQEQKLTVKNIQIIPNRGGIVRASGSLGLGQKKSLQFQLNSTNFNPNHIHQNLPQGKVNGSIQVSGTLSEQPDLRLNMAWKDSVLSGEPLAGNVQIHYQNNYLEQSDVYITLGKNIIHTQGKLGSPESQLNVNITAPDLNLFGLGLQGSLLANGKIKGLFKQLDTNLSGYIHQFKFRDTAAIEQLDFHLEGASNRQSPLNVQLHGKTIKLPEIFIATIDTSLKGSGEKHTLNLQSDLQFNQKNYHIYVAADGGLNQQHQWDGQVSRFDIANAFNLTLLNPIHITAGSDKIAMSNAHWKLMNGSLHLDTLQWNKTSGITTKGQATQLDLSQLENIVHLPIKQNLVISGNWDLSYSDNANGYLKINQQSGDIIIPYRNQNLGLKDIILNVQFHNNSIDTRLSGQTRYGEANANINIAQKFGQDIIQAPLSGHIRLDVPNLESIRYLLPVGMEVKGSLLADTTVNGTVGNPLLNGTLTGEQLYYRNRDLGIFLENGTLDSHLDGRTWIIDKLNFQRKTGQARLNGTVDLSNNTPKVDVGVQFSHYNLIEQSDRNLTLSGDAKFSYNTAEGIVLSGKLLTEKGKIGLIQSDIASLDDDIVIVGEAPKEANVKIPFTLDLTLDLNKQFHFSGEGLNVLLGGQLAITSAPKKDLQIVGTINIIEGQFKAYGQDLLIEQGSISFVGPVGNPNLQLRALRRFSPVGAGIEVTGSLKAPKTSLIANESMSEKEKLSWLILGRSSSGSSADQAALGITAGAWLADALNNKIGLVDEFGLSSEQSRDAQTGELNPAEQIITIGKQLTNKLHLGYQYGLNTTKQSILLTYQISQALRAATRIGTDSIGGEMHYIIHFD